MVDCHHVLSFFNFLATFNISHIFLSFEPIEISFGWRRAVSNPISSYEVF